MIDWLLAHAPDPRHVFLFHLAHTALWVTLVAPSMLFWRDSVPYVVFMSIWALVLGSAANAAATLAEIKADPAIEVPTTQSGQDAPARINS